MKSLLSIIFCLLFSNCLISQENSSLSNPDLSKPGLSKPDLKPGVFNEKDSIIKLNKRVNELEINFNKMLDNNEIAGDQLINAKYSFFAGLLITIVGSAVTGYGLYLENNNKGTYNPATGTYINKPDYRPVYGIGALFTTAGIVVNLTSFHHVGKAGKYLQRK